MTPDPAASWHDLEFACADGFDMANAAYAAMTLSPTVIRLPPTYQFAGLLTATPPSPATLALTTTDKTAHPTLSMWKESPIWGCAVYQPSTGTVILAIRGTETLWEWIADFTALPVDFLYDPSAGQVHAGMQLVYQHIRMPAITLLQSCGPITRLRLVGHSLGAAICEPLALDLVEHGGFSCVPELTTYESPRFGTPEWVARFRKAIPDTRFDRVVNDGDRVPSLPLAPLFWHTGNRCEVYGGWKWEDISYAHALSTVRLGLNAAWVAHIQAVAPSIQVP
jgi:triacylglycerol lipase